MRSVELFSGCGGLALGLARAGFRHELLVEWNGCAVATVEHNRHSGLEFVSHWPIERADVRQIDWSRYAGVELVAGGPPCQPFSIGGRHGGAADERDMWPQAIRAVRDIRPSAFLFENVRGLLRPKFRDYLKSIKDRLERPDPRSSLRYSVVVLAVNAADFGAPQKRHRVIVAGIRSDLGSDLSILQATHSRDRLLWDQWVTGEYWRQHGLSRPKGGPPKLDRAAVVRLEAIGESPSEHRWVTVRDALHGLGAPSGEGNHVFQPGARVYKGHTGSCLDQPAKALKAGDHGVPGGENMMILQNDGVRYFTIREAARLQGLPDEFEFPRSWSESMRQLGNAVPTQLAEAVGRWIKNTISGLGDDLLKAA